jgi:hypothetical protein
MRLVGRIVWCALSLLLAIPAGALALFAATILDPVANALLGDVLWIGFQTLLDGLPDLDEAHAAEPLAALSSAAFALLVAPLGFTALAAEVMGWRSLLWHAGGTGAITAAVPWLARGEAQGLSAGEGHLTAVLFLVGATAGLVHWLIAGRDAGGRAEAFVPGEARRG